MSGHNYKPQIGIVCDTMPYPTRSGDNQRIAELIRVLRQEGWCVHFVLAGFLDRRSHKVCRDNVDVLHVYAGKGWRTLLRNSLRRCVRRFDGIISHFNLPPLEELASRVLGRSMSPMILDYWKRYPAGLDDFVAGLAEKFGWKVVIVEYIWLFPAIQKLRVGVLRLLDTQDVQHKRVEEFASRGMSFPLQITREQETRIFNAFDAVIAIQAAEARDIRAMCPNVTVLTVGSTGSKSEDHSDAIVEGRILYVGGFNGANIDGLRRFLSITWPRVRKENAQAHLHVCGFVHRGFLGEEHEQVKFLGHVRNVESEYAHAALVINPVWIGTGLKIKTVEALARGKPLVTTPKGIEGMDGGVKDSAIICNDAVELADSLNHLLRDSNARHKLAEAAKRFATQQLSTSAVYGELLTYLNHRKEIQTELLS